MKGVPIAIRKLALTEILNAVDGMTKGSYAQYDKVAVNETNCGYTENFLMNTVGQYGEDLLVSVVKGQALEIVRLRRLR